MFEPEKTKNEVARRVLERFGKITISGLSNPEILSIMEYINEYWKESYRPALISLSCEAVGGTSATVEDAGLVVSLIVAGMSIHDDIIDKSINKHLRTKKTVYGLYGSDKALLAGDLVLLKGLIIASEVFQDKISAKKYLDIIDALRKFIFEMYEGEFMEVCSRKNLGIGIEYQKQYLWKFTSDAEACARIGAILGDGSDAEVEALAEFARRFAFNLFLREELKDSFNLEDNLIHKLEHESLPLTVLYSAKDSKLMFRKIKSIVGKSRITKNDAVRLICYGYETGAYDYIYDIAQQNTKKALQKIAVLSSSSARKELELMIAKSLTEIEGIQKDTDAHQRN